MRIVLAAILAALLSTGAHAQAPRAPAPATRPAPPPAATVPAPAPAAPVATGPKVDVNGATAAQLDSLPGIGPARAAAIVAGRPYTDLQELVSKKVLSQSVLDGAKSRMALANINTSGEADMEKTLPGIGAVRAKAIIAGRPYASPQDLVTKKVLPQGVFDKMKDLVAY